MTAYSMSSMYGIIRYAYADKDAGFGFAANLLSEVGEPYRQWFYDEIARRGWVIERGIVFDMYPWCADMLLRKVEEGQGYVDTSY